MTGPSPRPPQASSPPTDHAAPPDEAAAEPGVVLVGPDAAAVAEAVAALRQVGSRAAGFVGDPADPTDVAAAAEQAAELFGDTGVVRPADS